MARIEHGWNMNLRIHMTRASEETSLKALEKRRTTLGPNSSESLRVLFISRDFPPVSHSGTLRSEAFTTWLPDHGIAPIIFTADPATASVVAGLEYVILDCWRDDDRWPAVTRVEWGRSQNTNPGWRRFWQRIPIANHWRSRRDREDVVSRLMVKAEQTIRVHQPQAIYASAHPTETLFLATELGERYRLPVIADLRDPWSYQPNLAYRSIVDFWLERRLERSVLRKCDRVIVNARGTETLETEYVGLSREQFRLIRNGYDDLDFDGVANLHEPLDAHRFVLVHVGQLAKQGAAGVQRWHRFKKRIGLDYYPLRVEAMTRSPHFVLAAVERLLEQKPLLRDDIRIWFVGMSHPEECEDIRRFRFPECLRIIPRVDSKTAADIMCRADLLLLLQYEYSLRGRGLCPAIPAKLYSYLRSGRRILACVQPSEIVEFLEKHEAGQVVAPRDVDAIASGIFREYEDAKSRTAHRRTALRDLPRLTRRYQAGELAATIREVVSARSRGA